MQTRGRTPPSRRHSGSCRDGVALRDTHVEKPVWEGVAEDVGAGSVRHSRSEGDDAGIEFTQLLESFAENLLVPRQASASLS